MIPITKPWTAEEEIALVGEVIRSGWLTQGPRTGDFEKILSEWIGARHVVAVSSCTTALHLAVLLAGLKPGDEALLPSYTFVATANALLYAGVKPVFVEIDPRTFNIDPGRLNDFLTPKTKAVIAVDQFGLAADLDALEGFCAQNRLQLIEDAACAIGALYRNRKIGAKGRLVTFSFHPRKSITTGEGGALITDDASLAEEATLLRSHGASVSGWTRHQAKGVTFETYTALGYNYRLSDIQAALGLAQVPRLTTILERRRSLAQRYDEELKALGWIDSPYVPSFAQHAYQSYATLIRPDAPVKRDALIQGLAEKGISTRRGIPPIHREPYMKSRLGSLPDLPITDDVSQRTLILPLYPQMTINEQDQVIEALKTATTIRP